jgi:RNA polymerase sigma-70 factor (ECF subfamily)
MKFLNKEKNNNLEDIFRDTANQNYNSIYKYCYFHLFYNKELAEECTQEVFTTLYVSLNKLTNYDNLRAWLYRTADNYVFRYVKKVSIESKHQISYDSEDSFDIIDTTQEFETILDKEINEEEFVIKIFDSFSVSENQIYQLYFREKKSLNQISSILNISETTVTTRIYRLKNKVKKIAHSLMDCEKIL